MRRPGKDGAAEHRAGREARGVKGKALALPVLALIVLSAAALVFYWPILIGAPFGKAWFWEDFLEQNFPYRFYQATHMSEGEFPLWNPYIFGGLPFAADVQAAAFYPPNWLLALFVRGGQLQPEPAEALQIAHVVIGGVLMALLARSLFGGRAGPLFAGAGFAFSALMVVRMKHGNIVEAAAWMPGVLLFAREAVRRGSSAAAAMAATLFALAFLTGAPQYIVYLLIAVVLFAGHEAFTARGERPVAGSALRVLLALALALMLSAVALLPSLELASETLRGNLSYGAASEVSFHPRNLVTFLLPTFFGSTAGGYTTRFFGGQYYEFWELACYVGMPTLLLAVLGLARPLASVARGVAIFGGFGFLLALGRYGPIHPLLFHLLPPYQRFRVPGRAIILVVLALLLLAARGLARLEEGPLDAGRRKLLVRAAAVLAALVLIATGAGLAAGPASAASARVAGALVALASLGVSWWVIARAGAGARGDGSRAHSGKVAPPEGRRVAHLLTLILLIDLALFGMSYNLGPTHPISAVLSKANIVDFLRKNVGNDGARATIRAPEGLLLLRNAGSLLRIGTLDGYNQLRLRRSHELLTKAESDPSRFFSLWAARYVTRPGTEPGTLALARNPDVLPRARLVHAAEVMNDEGAILGALSRSDHDLARTVILEQGSAAVWPSPSDEPAPRVTRLSADRIDVAVDAKAPGYLVLADPFYPGWEASIDGRLTPILRADYALRAVAVDAGSHDVVFRFRPRSIRTGVLLSLGGVALIIGFLVAPRGGARGVAAALRGD